MIVCRLVVFVLVSCLSVGVVGAAVSSGDKIDPLVRAEFGQKDYPDREKLKTQKPDMVQEKTQIFG